MDMVHDLIFTWSEGALQDNMLLFFKGFIYMFGEAMSRVLSKATGLFNIVNGD
jgi:hypothetical protein